MPLVLLPSQPFAPRIIDSDFENERGAAVAAGLTVALIDHTMVTRGAAEAAVASVPANSGEALYRGWMMTAREYQHLHGALDAKGVRLLNAPQAYRCCHHLPESYPLIEGKTPRSVWLPLSGSVDFDAVMALIRPFGDGPLVLKDYVKSQKHAWTEACFIPRASDRGSVERVVRRFLELQGDSLSVGLVFREFVPLRQLGTHPKSGAPLAAEFRTFWLDGELILAHRYWGDLTPIDVPLPIEDLAGIAGRVPSRLFSMDVAFLEDGTWTIVELGDGQVTGLPSAELAPRFYVKLKQGLERKE
jgi:hypothetical protein